MTRGLLVRGMLVGLLAGLLVFAVGKILGEPQVGRAISFESAVDDAKLKAEAAAHPDRPARLPEPALVSRSNQAGLGLLTGTVVYGTAFGGLFALVFAYAYGRLGRGSPRDIAALLATFGLLGLYCIPALKYPANPPSVGNPDTITSRTMLYFIMLATSVGSMIGGLVLRKRLLQRLGAWNASLAGLAAYLVVVAIAMVLLPPVQEVPAAFSADLLWKFRIASLAMQTTLWATLGLVFGVLTERALGAPYRSTGTVMRTLVR